MTLVLTGSINLTSGGITTDRDGVYSGSFSGSLVGDGSGLTGVTGGGGSSDFPYTGSAIISGSLEVDGITEVISGSIIGDGSGLTDVQIFPFEGQADIIGGFKLDGEFELNYLLSSNDAWSTGGSLNIGRHTAGGTGTQNAALIFGGVISSPATDTVGYTEAYNGSTWSSKDTLNQSRLGAGGAGTQNSALAFGGCCSPTARFANTEEYNGNTWTTSGDLNVARNRARGSGTQNAALTAGGQGNAPTIRACTEEYNGLTWANGGVLNTTPSLNLWEGAVGGTQNAAIYFAGACSPSGQASTCTEEYNGTSWSIGGALNTVGARERGGAGDQQTALAFGGNLGFPYQTATEKYNGLSWSYGANLPAGRSYFAGSAGNKLAGLAVGGFPSDTCTGEYNADACYKKHLYSQQNTVYSNQLYVTGSATADALLNLANRDTTPDPLTEGMIWQSGSANSGCLYFSPDGTSICKISFA